MNSMWKRGGCSAFTSYPATTLRLPPSPQPDAASRSPCGVDAALPVTHVLTSGLTHLDLI